MEPAKVWKIDGTPVDATPQTIAGQLLATVPDLEFRSIEALKDLFNNLLSLSIEMALIERETTKGAAQSALTRHITATRKQIAHIPEDRERLLTALFDRILQCEGLGLLVGFSFGVGPRKNAERESTVAQLYEYKNKKEKIMATKKKDDTKIKRSELIAAAKEMNRILVAPGKEEIEVNMPPAELITILIEAKELLKPGDKVDPAVKKILDRLPKPVAAVPAEKVPAEKKEMAAAAAKKVEASGKKEPAEKKVSKKSIIIDILNAKGGTVDEMAKACTDAGLGDLAQNMKTVKLWLRKIGFPVTEANGVYKKSAEK